MNHSPGIRLSELSTVVGTAIREAFRSQSYWVMADVTSHVHKQQTNYHYFELVEKDAASSTLLARFSARAWGTGSQKIALFEQVTGQKFGNDINVLVNVTVEYHPSYGLQLCVTDIDPNFTLGRLEQQRQATLLQLMQHNPEHIRLIDNKYITYNKSVSLGIVVQRLAVLTSSTSAGFQDFRHTLENNTNRYKFYLDHYPVAVHGENNSRRFVEKMIEVYESGIHYDALVIVRGGGAQTDLLMFNDYLIGKAIARFPIPVITGIGHLKNETIADLMAHTSTKTPTQAAEYIIDHNRKFENNLLNQQKHVIIRAQQVLSVNFKELNEMRSGIITWVPRLLQENKDLLLKADQHLSTQARALVSVHKSALFAISYKLSSGPLSVIQSRRTDIRNFSRNLASFCNLYFKTNHRELSNFVSLITTMSPENILKKGFALVKVGGRITARADDIVPGETISVILYGDHIIAEVKSKEKYDRKDFNL